MELGSSSQGSQYQWQGAILHDSPRCPNSPVLGTLMKEVKFCKQQLPSWLSAEHHLVGQAWPDSGSGTSGEKRVTAEAPRSRAISDWQEAEGSLARGRNV